MYTGYGQDMALLNTGAKKAALAVLLVVALLLPFVLEDELLRLLATGAVLAIGAIGLNLVTGYAGQVSLGHAFFLGIGAYTAAVVSGETGDEDLYGFGITFIPVWLLAGGAMAALVGLVVAPLASRLRGLYLAIVTLGLVFLGEHVFREWDAVTGGVGVGRPAADPVLFGVDLSRSTDAFSADQQMYLLMTALLVLFALLGRNIARSAIGRSFAAVRDRDIAAEVTGVDVRKAKRLAFVISGFYAGCAGALLYSISGYLDPSSFGLLVSVQFVAMVLIGGVATISGSIMGAFFIAILPRLTRELPEYLPFLSSSATEFPNVFQVETLLYGLLIVAFLIFEPRGLFGVWVRARNYWKSWPFSY
ncbi:branched-chain amino acid ABC transporter permease [Geodermatophilus sp. Leaf369]|jgi:branched-chain amino acid transport system permease protein|nr:branched-chain amino acid ABC transporter permease [Geodermatophilus sp. Leaf369]QNG38951.1 branched-chain amino acid ABC transporter permease [Geodermatophilaceae bacterium NBWT11]